MLTFVAALGIAGLDGAAGKEPDLGPFVLPPSQLSPEDEARAALARYAKCNILTYSKAVASAISLPVAKGNKALSKIGDERCAVYAIQTGGQLRASDAAGRGAYFTELFRQHQALPSGGQWQFPIPPLDLSARPPQGSSPEVTVQFFMLVVSACVFKRAPDVVRNIVANQPGTVEQNTAFASVAGDLAACLPPGQTVTFSKAMIEGGFGEYLYRSLTKVPAASSEVTH